MIYHELSQFLSVDSMIKLLISIINSSLKLIQ